MSVTLMNLNFAGRCISPSAAKWALAALPPDVRKGSAFPDGPG